MKKAKKFNKGVKMTELKTFKINYEFNGTADLYRYLIENVDFVGELIGIQIQKPLKIRPFCIIGKEKRIASRGRRFDSVGLCKQDEQVNQKTRLTRATKKITERNILFFATKNDIPADLGELLTLAGSLEPDIIVFLLNKASIIYIDSINWLQNICNEDTQFIVGEVQF